MGRLRHRLHHLEAPPMLQRRYLGARGGHGRRVDLRQDDAGLVAALGDDAAPGIDHERVTVGLAAVLMLAALRGREDEGAVLDGAGAVEHVPMGFAGLLRERRGDGEKRGARLRQRAIERGEAQVVANREAEPAPWQVGGHGDLAGPVVAGFAIALAAGEIDVEHVDLVVARDDLAAAVDQERAVGSPLGRELDRKRADMEEDAEAAGRLAERREARIGLLRCDRRKQPLALDLENVGHLRRKHVVGAAVLGLADQLQRGIEVGGRRHARSHLHQAGGEGRAHGVAPGPDAAGAAGAKTEARSGSRPPFWSSS